MKKIIKYSSKDVWEREEGRSYRQHTPCRKDRHHSHPLDLHFYLLPLSLSVSAIWPVGYRYSNNSPLSPSPLSLSLPDSKELIRISRFDWTRKLTAKETKITDKTRRRMTDSSLVMPMEMAQILATEMANWWEEVNESTQWQDGIFFALCGAYALVSAIALVRSHLSLSLSKSSSFR